jgi:hypothetical protein
MRKVISLFVMCAASQQQLQCQHNQATTRGSATAAAAAGAAVNISEILVLVCYSLCCSI